MREIKLIECLGSRSVIPSTVRAAIVHASELFRVAVELPAVAQIALRVLESISLAERIPPADFGK